MPLFFPEGRFFRAFILVLVQLVPQCANADAEDLRRSRAIALATLHCHKDVTFLKFREAKELA